MRPSPVKPSSFSGAALRLHPRSLTGIVSQLQQIVFLAVLVEDRIRQMTKPPLFNVRSFYKKIARFFMKSQTLKESSDLENYLSYYQGLQTPRYAVLVTGAWGVGKTFQVRSAIPPEIHYYVSLFGMRSAEEIDAAVFSQMDPLKAEARAIAEENAKTSVLGVPVGALGSLYARYGLKRQVKSDRIIIFDDLERSSIEPKELLGAINQYVEHHGCRVVVIAHDGELSNELKHQKEKIFGQVLSAIPQTNLAYPRFLKEIGREDEQKFLLEIQPPSSRYSMSLKRTPFASCAM